jgi:ferric-dicitrate binding protein FerR (iron transport regulator)
VLGTTFDVWRYPTDRGTRVAVTQGKVVVRADSTSAPSLGRPFVVLTAGSAGFVNDSIARTVPMGTLGEQVDWASGTLAFRRTPLRDALTTVGHWYGLEFRLADSALTRQSITATFDRRPVSDVLAVLKTLLDATMTFDGDTITVHARGTVHAPDSTLRHHDPMFSTQKEVGR